MVGHDLGVTSLEPTRIFTDKTGHTKVDDYTLYRKRESFWCQFGTPQGSRTKFQFRSGKKEFWLEDGV